MKWWEREAREETSYRELVYEAWADWQAAMNYFETVKDPELVDFAIYDLEAARRKYMYMLGQVRKDEAGKAVPLAVPEAPAAEAVSAGSQQA
ncbi:DUF2508 family protein [Gehongia tenuis]|uniref:DUF2508 family protein n=1 Tax=Gehongia tenuis TaxID=2763655 RepID=A0A926D4S2_9FIRM|nr:DUF2508 family protein [Gehongia tenuis]MBC8530340.1 DUF2508 family protein [Gehongia tenuis]